MNLALVFRPLLVVAILQLLTNPSIAQVHDTSDLSSLSFRVDIENGVPVTLGSRRCRFDETVYMSISRENTLLVGSIGLKKQATDSGFVFQRDYSEGKELFCVDSKSGEKYFRIRNGRKRLADPAEFRLPVG
ncbi:MAG: hypothetical protein R3C03_19480 [Pirellulaceae bacterium]